LDSALERNVAVVTWNTIIYGLLMLVGDMWRSQQKTVADIDPLAGFIDVAQALALMVMLYT
jgi:hypothetical protein